MNKYYTWQGIVKYFIDKYFFYISDFYWLQVPKTREIYEIEMKYDFTEKFLT